MLLQSYRAKITYLPDASRTSSFTAKHVCKAHCELCKAAGAAAHTDVFAPGNPFDGLPGAHWIVALTMLATVIFQVAWETSKLQLAANDELPCLGCL